MELGSMVISNNIYGVDSKNKNVYIRELELNTEDSDYVRSSFEKFWLTFFKSIWLRKTQMRNHSPCYVIYVFLL